MFFRHSEQNTKVAPLENFVNQEQRNSSPLFKRRGRRYCRIAEFFSILKTFFLIHGIYFNAENKGCCLSRIISVFLAVAYEINSFVNFYILNYADDLTIYKNITIGICALIFLLLEIIQRFYLHKCNEKFMKLFNRSMKIYFE